MGRYAPRGTPSDQQLLSVPFGHMPNTAGPWPSSRDKGSGLTKHFNLLSSFLEQEGRLALPDVLCLKQALEVISCGA